MKSVLEIRNLTVNYGNIRAVEAISFDVMEGEIVTLIGANGAGKSSTLRALSGIAPYSGDILFKGRNLMGTAAHRIVAMGMAHVPEGRGIFGNLTVMENLKLATWQRKDPKEVRKDYEEVFHIFPRLRDRRDQPGETLSGGEQQMLALARALMTKGEVMLLDEPSMGLAPVLVTEIFRVLQEINRSGTTILLVEQNARMALSIAHRAYVLETGRILFSGTGEELLADDRVKEAYLGC